MAAVPQYTGRSSHLLNFPCRPVADVCVSEDAVIGNTPTAYWHIVPRASNNLSDILLPVDVGTDVDI